MYVLTLGNSIWFCLSICLDFSLMSLALCLWLDFSLLSLACVPGLTLVYCLWPCVPGLTLVYMCKVPTFCCYPISAPLEEGMGVPNFWHSAPDDGVRTPKGAQRKKRQKKKIDTRTFHNSLTFSSLFVQS